MGRWFPRQLWRRVRPEAELSNANAGDCYERFLRRRCRSLTASFSEAAGKSLVATSFLFHPHLGRFGLLPKPRSEQDASPAPAEDSPSAAPMSQVFRPITLTAANRGPQRDIVTRPARNGGQYRHQTGVPQPTRQWPAYRQTQGPPPEKRLAGPAQTIKSGVPHLMIVIHRQQIPMVVGRIMMNVSLAPQWRVRNPARASRLPYQRQHNEH